MVGKMPSIPRTFFSLQGIGSSGSMTGIVDDMPILAEMIAQHKSFDFIFRNFG
jgi:hypothetical protein